MIRPNQRVRLQAGSICGGGVRREEESKGMRGQTEVFGLGQDGAEHKRGLHLVIIHRTKEGNPRAATLITPVEIARHALGEHT